MRAELLNPEILPKQASKEEIAKLSQLPNEAWQVYAEASEIALAKVENS
ncbi:MAG: hypothetical protein HQL69_10650 [Magnetococcales bacterium]|nr:hypothetical protein [Magnetococcales bacterium]